MTEIVLRYVAQSGPVSPERHKSPLHSLTNGPGHDLNCHGLQNANLSFPHFPLKWKNVSLCVYGRVWVV